MRIKKYLLVLVTFSSIANASTSSSSLTVMAQVNDVCHTGFGSLLQPIATLDFGAMLPGSSYANNTAFYISCTSGTVINGVDVTSQNSWNLNGKYLNYAIPYSINLYGQTGAGYTGGLFTSKPVRSNPTVNILTSPAITMSDQVLGTTMEFDATINSAAPVDTYQDTLTLTTSY